MSASKEPRWLLAMMSDYEPSEPVYGVEIPLYALQPKSFFSLPLQAV